MVKSNTSYSNGLKSLLVDGWVIAGCDFLSDFLSDILSVILSVFLIVFLCVILSVFLSVILIS